MRDCLSSGCSLRKCNGRIWHDFKILCFCFSMAFSPGMFAINSDYPLNLSVASRFLYLASLFNFLERMKLITCDKSICSLPVSSVWILCPTVCVGSARLSDDWLASAFQQLRTSRSCLWSADTSFFGTSIRPSSRQRFVALLFSIETRVVNMALPYMDNKCV